jgi:arylsulfatase A-like enzyme
MAIGKTSDFIASGPGHISLPGYNEITHGHPSTCQQNTCPQTTEATFIDRLALPDTAVITSWEEIGRAATNNPNSLVLNTGRMYRKNWKDLDNMVFPWLVGEQPYRSDSYTGKAAALYAHNHHPRFMWVGFGDTDEWAHAGQYPKYLTSMTYVDSWLEELLNNEPDYMRNTDVIITADHGRGIDWRSHGWDKASEKDWLIMCGRDIPSWGFVGYTEVKSLSNVAPTIEKLMTEKQMIGSLI